MDYNFSISALLRLKQALGVETDTDLGKRLEVNQSTISGWKSRDALDFRKIIDICNREGISLDWIFHGTGSPKDPGGQETLRELARVYQRKESEAPQGVSTLWMVEKLKGDISKTKATLKAQLDSLESGKKSLLEQADIALDRADVKLERKRLEVQREILDLERTIDSTRDDLHTVYELLASMNPPSH